MCSFLAPWMTSRTHRRDSWILSLAVKDSERGKWANCDLFRNFEPSLSNTSSLLSLDFCSYSFPSFFVLPEVLFPLFMILTYFEVPLIRWFPNCSLLCLEMESESESRSVMSDSLGPHGLYSSWNSPGQNTGVGSLSLLQRIFPTQGSNPGLPHCRRILYQLSHQGSFEDSAKF